MTNRHIVTEHGIVFAVSLIGDTVANAIEVDEVEAYLLDQQVEEAKLAYDLDQQLACQSLTEMLLRGEATPITAYFQVDV
jgi:hypothetical protein